MQSERTARHARRLALAATTALLPANTLAAAISWTNPGAGDWFDPLNWSLAVPTQADDGSVNNGGTAIAVGAVSPSARSLSVGAGTSALQTGTAVISELDLLLGNVSGALRVGSATAASATAVGVLVVDGSIGGFAPGSSIGASATGTLSLGTGDLTLAGSAAIGFADIDLGAAATGTVTLGGALSTSGAGATLQLGTATGTSITGLGAGSAVGSLAASGLLGFADVAIGTTTTHNGNAVTATGTTTIGAGGIVTDPAGGRLRIGRANGVAVNGSVTGPGATAEGSAAVAGDITGYVGVEVGHVVNTGMARGSLAVTGGTITTGILSVGEVQRSAPTIIDGQADAEGTLSVTNGAIVADIVRIGRGSTFGGPVATDRAVGTATLAASSLSTTILEIGVSGGQGSLHAGAGSAITAAGGVNVGSDGASGNGSGTFTLLNSSLTVAAVPNGFDGSMVVGFGGGDAQVTALASTVGIDGVLLIGSFGGDATAEARMALSGSTLAVGGGIGIGYFQPGSRGELALTDSTATVGGNVRVGLSANNGTLFGEALLALDASLLDITGTLTTDLGAETWFGVQGTDRGLGRYGAINALAAVLDGLITVDFAGLDDFDLASFAFDLIVTEDGILGDFDVVSLLNLPVGYLASYGITSDGEIWRVTLTQANAVPEPGAVALLLAGLAGLALTLRRRAA